MEWPRRKSTHVRKDCSADSFPKARIQTVRVKSGIYDNEVLCPHPKCKAVNLVLPSVMAFKNHTAKVHKIFLRV